MGLTRSTKLRKSLKEQKQVHAGSGHAAVLFRYSPDRKGEHPREHLCGFSGVLQAIITGVVIHVSLQPGNGALNELLKTAHETDWANLASGVLRQGSGANRRSDPAVCQRSRNAGSPCPDIMLTNSMLERFSLTSELRKRSLANSWGIADGCHGTSSCESGLHNLRTSRAKAQ